MTDIPKQNGFSFTGVTANGTKLACMVLFNRRTGEFEIHDCGSGSPIDSARLVEWYVKGKG